MATMTLEVATGGFNSPGQVVRPLILFEQRRQWRRELAAAIIEGMEGGPAIPMTKESMDKKLREARERRAGGSAPG